MSFALRPLVARLAGLFVLTSAMGSAHAAFELIGIGTLGGTTDLSGLTGTLENGNPASILGGMGSGLAWAGGNTFLALPDRGPNAVAYTGGSAIDNTTSYIARFNTVTLDVTATPSAVPAGTVPYTVTPTLQSTTLLWSSTPLTYGSTAGLPSAVPSQNTAGKYYFTGRSDGFVAGSSSNVNDARLDPESIRVSKDGKSIYVSDEYGPYVYQFDRSTGERTRSFTLPSNLAVPNANAVGATEISGNTVGRVANKGMEGLAISPDGKTLFGFMQSPLAQDGGDGGRYNRIVKIDIASGAVSQFAFDNQINGKAYNSSELLALNDHELIVLERDGKGLGDGTKAAVKQLVKIDLTGATEVSNITDLRTQPGAAIVGTKFLDIRAALNAAGVPDARIPAKLEGIAFGEDVVVNGKTMHTLYLANDNDFLATTIPNGSTTAIPYGNQFYVFGFEGDLVNQAISAVPEPSQYALLLAGLGLVGAVARRRNRG